MLFSGLTAQKRRSGDAVWDARRSSFEEQRPVMGKFQQIWNKCVSLLNVETTGLLEHLWNKKADNGVETLAIPEARLGTQLPLKYRAQFEP
jgi:hypothetical protein